VLDQQDGDPALANLVNRLHQGQPLSLVQAGGWLIQHQQLRLGGQGAGDFQATLVAVGQVARQFIRPVGQADEGQMVHGPLHDELLFFQRGRQLEQRAERPGPPPVPPIANAPPLGQTRSGLPQEGTGWFLVRPA